MFENKQDYCIGYLIVAEYVVALSSNDSISVFVSYQPCIANVSLWSISFRKFPLFCASQKSA